MKTARRRLPSVAAPEAGFSLIEILVAVLIVSVGVLGVAGLQLVSLQNNTSAMFRTQAFQAGYEIADRMRVNPAVDYAISIGDAAPVIPDCESADCTPLQMRNYDLGTWLNDLAANLPNGDGEIAVAGGAITIIVQWQDERNPAMGPLSVTVTTTI